MSIAKNQHWVPQLYLNGFCTQNNSGSIHVTNIKAIYQGLPVGGEKRRLENVAALSHLYNFTDKNGNIDPTLDLFIGSIESLATPIWQRMIKGKVDVSLPRGSDDRRIVALFMAIQHLRVPRMAAVAKYVALNSNTLPDVSSQEGRDDFYEKVAQTPIDLSPTQAGMNDRISFRLGQILALRDVFRAIDGRHWKVLKFEKRVVITSDTPLCSVHRDTMEPIGLGDRNALVFFPLTANLLLLGTGTPLKEPPDGAIEPSSIAIAIKLNPFIAHYATNEVYSPTMLDDSFPFLSDH